MTRRHSITRRDFVNGIALGVAAGSTLSPRDLLAGLEQKQAYPPALTGMRGNHAGSYEIAHARAIHGATWPRPTRQTDKDYDLVVVGGGISGLTSAFLYRQQAGPEARILVIDNHDDFGGHAKRNEFTVDGKRIISYGGSQSIDSPSTYSKAAAQVLREIGIDVEKFYQYFDQNYYGDRDLARGVYFSAKHYGKDSSHAMAVTQWQRGHASDAEELIGAYPLTDAAKKDFWRLLSEPRDYLEGRDRDDKIALLRRTSYSDFLRKYASVHEDVVILLRDFPKSLWGFGYDALSALEGFRLGMPGTSHLEIDGFVPTPYSDDEPYIFHFPDGNAGVARALVRKLIPAALAGTSMENLVVGQVDYSKLDLQQNNTRMRLNSTAVDVRHIAGGSAVDVTYVNNSEAQRVRGKHVILACYNHMVPSICPELPAAQAEAIALLEKVPLTYVNVMLRNWRAFENLGLRDFHVPQADLMHSFGLDFPVSVGDYQFARTSADPIVVHGVFAPTVPDQGYSEREQHVLGRRRMLDMTFDDFEAQIIQQMNGALHGGGFDAERDIAGITVNRWPHGYAYEYNELFDPPEWNRKSGPHRIGAAQLGRISIANSDSEAYAYVNGAMDAAVRAVSEQI